MKNYSKYREGFTLIELLVVVLIIGILSATALPQYQKAVTKARATEAVSVMSNILNAEKVYKLSNGQYTDDLTKLDIDYPLNQYGTMDDSATRYYSFYGATTANSEFKYAAYPKNNGGDGHLIVGWITNKGQKIVFCTKNDWVVGQNVTNTCKSIANGDEHGVIVGSYSAI